jgi:putative Mg2+ transporter-C (MgtC) family protein
MDEWLALLGPTHLSPGQIALRLGAAIGFACLIGLDRELKHKPLGLRTNMLMALGSASFSIIVIELMHLPAPGPNAGPIDPGRVIEGIIGGIGFLGAGAIIRERSDIRGATTGAAIWAVGAIGVACGFGYYVHAGLIMLLALFVMTVLGFLTAGHERED